MEINWIIFLLIVVFIVSIEIYVRKENTKWSHKQNLVNLAIVTLGFSAVFSEGMISYILWPLFVIFTLVHLNDFKTLHRK